MWTKYEPVRGPRPRSKKARPYARFNKTGQCSLSGGVTDMFGKNKRTDVYYNSDEIALAPTNKGTHKISLQQGNWRRVSLSGVLHVMGFKPSPKYRYPVRKHYSRVIISFGKSKEAQCGTS